MSGEMPYAPRSIKLYRFSLIQRVHSSLLSPGGAFEAGFRRSLINSFAVHSRPSRFTAGKQRQDSGTFHRSGIAFVLRRMKSQTPWAWLVVLVNSRPNTAQIERASARQPQILRLGCACSGCQSVSKYRSLAGRICQPSLPAPVTRSYKLAEERMRLQRLRLELGMELAA